MKRIINFDKKKNIDLLIVYICSIIFFTILIVKYGISYYINDDIAIRSILSGEYTGIPSTYAIFATFPYTVIITFLYKITNTIDWYGLSQILLIMFFCVYTVHNIVQNRQKTLEKIICCIFVFLVLTILYGKFLVEITFTTTAAFITICCLVLFLLPDKKMKKLVISIGIILAFGIRPKACLMILIFFLPALIYKNYRNIEKLKKDFFFGFKIAIILLICIVIEKSMYGSADWKEYLRYNKYRSLYYDYYSSQIDKLPEDEKKEIYYAAGLNDVQMELLGTWEGIGLYDDIYDKMEKLVEQCEIHNLKTNPNLIENALNLVKTQHGMMYIISVFLILISVLEDKEDKKRILPFLIFQIIILLYLIIDGRTVERVVIPLFSCYIITNFYIILQNRKIRNFIKEILNNKEITCIILLTIMLFISTQSIKIENYNYFSIARENLVKKYLESNSENLYIYDNIGLEYVRIFNKPNIKNYINMSGWTIFSPVYNELLNKYGVKSLRELLFKENVYLMTTELSEEILKRIEPNIDVQKVDYVWGYNVYKFTREE